MKGCWEVPGGAAAAVAIEGAGLGVGLVLAEGTLPGVCWPEEGVRPVRRSRAGWGEALRADLEASSAMRLEPLVLLEEEEVGLGGCGEGECLDPAGRGTEITCTGT